MRKREFLRRLGNALSHLDRDERNDILDYYDELIEDTIDKTGKSEADVIYDLGEIEDIARRVDPSHRSRIRYDEDEERPSYHEKRRKEHRDREEYRETSSSTRTGVGIVLLICLFPLWITLFALLFGLIVAVVASGLGCFAGGIVCIWQGCTLFTISWAQAIFRIGVGLTLAGAVLIVAPLLMKIVMGIGHLIIAFFRWLFGGRS